MLAEISPDPEALLVVNDRIILLISLTLTSGKPKDFSMVIEDFVLNIVTHLVRAITFLHIPIWINAVFYRCLFLPR